MLDAHSLSSVGILVNELVSNSIKYAFPSGGSGEIHVQGEKDRAHYTLTVRDNGVGLSPMSERSFIHPSTRPSGAGAGAGSMAGAADPGSRGFGTVLVEALALQLKGELSVSGNGGTRVRVRFPIVATTR